MGEGAERVGRLLERAGTARGVAVALAPATPDIGRLASALSLPILAQHVDPFEPGPFTGHVTPDAVRAAGGRGSLVNHSERPMELLTIRSAVNGLRALGLVAVVCARDAADARRVASVHPPYLAVEPPELIGGNRAVSTARPEVISETVAAVREVAPNTRVLCGAGIHTGADVAKALELGSEGVLVSSAVARAPDPGRALDDLLAGF